MQLPCFTNLHNIWYFNNKKIVPLNIKDMLTSLALAILIMASAEMEANKMKVFI